MKTYVVLASVLAAAGSAVADSPFRMLAVSKGATFDGSYIRGTGGRFVLGKQTNSTCGSTAPSFSTTNGTITLYGDGKENAQLVSLDISGAAGGLLSYKNYPYDLTNDDITDGFSRAASAGGVVNLLYNMSGWLACPQTEEGVYSIYAKDAYAGKADKQTCLPLGIVAQSVENPEVCQLP